MANMTFKASLLPSTTGTTVTSYSLGSSSSIWKEFFTKVLKIQETNSNTPKGVALEYDETLETLNFNFE